MTNLTPDHAIKLAVLCGFLVATEKSDDRATTYQGILNKLEAEWLDAAALNTIKTQVKTLVDAERAEAALVMEGIVNVGTNTSCFFKPTLAVGKATLTSAYYHAATEVGPARADTFADLANRLAHNAPAGVAAECQTRAHHLVAARESQRQLLHTFIAGLL